MKLTWRWITEFLRTDLTPQNAADRLVNGGVDVGKVARLAPDLEGVLVGEVEAIERDLGDHRGHHLVLVRVSTGRQRFSVVCGAPNCRPGVRAAFAPPGARLPGGRQITVLRVQGVESQGMLCSERELGLGDEHEAGVLVVGGDAPLGGDLVLHLGLDDWVLEVEVTPNRPDCLSVVGLARELAALGGGKFEYPAVAVTEGPGESQALARVRIEDPALCPRYAARVLTGVGVTRSPAWLAARLRAVGLRPISNVVDVTNYVLWELGHPLHAFDYDAVAEQTIVVRPARAGERLTTLDGRDRLLEAGMLVIADPRRPIAVAGVMGGLDTEVTERTTRVLLESAYFEPRSIRRTSRSLGLPTDAAYRFERGADIEALRDALDRAAQLVVDVAGGVIARGVLDAYPAPRRRLTVGLRMGRLQRVIGASPPVEDVARILEGLRLPVRRAGDAIEVEVPSFRRDIASEDDLVEEVIRVWGYDRIPSTLPGGTLSLVRRPPAHLQAEIVRRALQAAGLHEVVTYSFEDPADQAALGLSGDGVRLLNPLGQAASVLKADLLSGLLRVIGTNVRRQQPTVRIFELAAQFARAGGRIVESRWLALALTGSRSDLAWYADRAPADVWDAKGLAEHVLGLLGVAETTVDASPGAQAYFEPGHWGRLAAGGEPVAVFGEVKPAVQEAFGIPSPVMAAAVALDRVAGRPAAPVHFVPLPRHPSIHRDLALVLPLALPAAEVERAIRAAGGPLLRGVTLFDLYTGAGLEAGVRSVAWRLSFRAEDRTLTDAEVNDVHHHIVEAVRRRFGVEVRGT
jgi:phenylalanyl-tRNA synthetase beta chain